jgi:hypothetical protein
MSANALECMEVLLVAYTMQLEYFFIVYKFGYLIYLFFLIKINLLFCLLMYVQIFKRKFSTRKIRKIYTVQFKKKLTTVCQKIYIEKHFESDNVEVFFELCIYFI